MISAGLPVARSSSSNPLMVCALTAQANNERGGYVGALAQVDQYVGDPAQIQRELTAPLVVEIADGSLYLAADGLGHVVGADNAGNYGYQVPGAVLSVRPPIALKFYLHRLPLPIPVAPSPQGL